MSVRAKFYCAVKIQRGNTPYQNQPNQPNPVYESLEFYPVLDGSEENKQFFGATPSGKLEMGILNPEAEKQFEVGKEYYIDFTPAN